MAAIDCSAANAYVPERAKWFSIEVDAHSFLIENQANKKCMSVEKTGGNPKIIFEKCSKTSRYQQWYFKD